MINQLMKTTGQGIKSEKVVQSATNTSSRWRSGSRTGERAGAGMRRKRSRFVMMQRKNAISYPIHPKMPVDMMVHAQV